MEVTPSAPEAVSTPPAAPPLRGRRRRLRTLATTGITVLAITATMVIANVVSERYHLRFDATAAGTQRLAPRTEKLLQRLDGPVRVVVAADLKSIDQRSRERLRDVLSEMKRSSGRVDYTLLDTTSSSGLEGYKALIRELATRDEAAIGAQRAAVAAAAGTAQGVGAVLTSETSPALLTIAGGIPDAGQMGQTNRQYFEQAAAACRLLTQDLGTAVARSNEALAQHLDDIPIPATDRAAKLLMDMLAKVVSQLTDLSQQVTRFAAAPPAAGTAATQARTLVPQIERQRDLAAVALESLRRLPRLDLLRVTDVLKSGSAALVMGPADMGLAAMDLESLLPSGAWLEASGAGKADLNRRVEELITTAIGGLVSPARPLVVLTHAERPFFELERTREGNFGAMLQRLQFRGADIIEWAATVDGGPPKLAESNPGNKRPVVYLTFPANTIEGAQSGNGTGVQRAAKMGDVILGLVKGGKNVLLSVNPCILQTYGQADPISPALEHFGLVVESGRPLLWDVVSPQGRRVETEHAVLPETSTGVIAGAVQGLRLLLPGAVALHETPAESGTPLHLWRLYSIPAGDRVWAESQWLPLWQTPPAQRGLMPNMPVFDDGRDVRWPQGMLGQKEQSWLVAAAVERRPVGEPPQRVVVVGSREWFSNAAVEPRISVDGRTAQVSPGNLELLESSIYWLANQDDLIAQSPAAQTVALIQPMDEKVLSGLRLTMILGLPLGVLGLGVVYRLVRG